MGPADASTVADWLDRWGPVSVIGLCIAMAALSKALAIRARQKAAEEDGPPPSPAPSPAQDMVRAFAAREVESRIAQDALLREIEFKIAKAREVKMKTVCKFETNGGPFEISIEADGSAVVSAMMRFGVSATWLLEPWQAKALAAVLAGKPSPKADLDVVEWLRLTAGTAHARKIRGLPEALDWLADHVQIKGRDAAWSFGAYDPTANAPLPSEAVRFCETLWRALGVNGQTAAVEAIENLNRDRRFLGTLRTRLRVDARGLDARLQADALDAIDGLERDARQSTESLEAIWARLGVSSHDAAMAKVDAINASRSRRDTFEDLALDALRASSPIDALARIRKLVEVVWIAQKWRVGEVTGGALCHALRYDFDFIQPDPAAQEGVLTVGQQIVADYETDAIGEACELAQAIDEAIEKAAAAARPKAWAER